MSFAPSPIGRALRNPILSGFHPDPSVCRVGDDYYLVTSSFEYFPGVPIFHSRDLTEWRPLGHVLTRASQLPLTRAKSSEGIFAPTLRHHQGTFYLITTNVGGGGNFYVTARDPVGPWSEPVWLTETSTGVDPSLFFDDDGRVYYTRQGGGERGGIYQQELDLRSGTLLGEPRLLWSGTGGFWPEGPHLYKIDGRYYLMIAEGGTGYDHAVTIARANSPWGPFEACPRNPILTHRDRDGHAIQATGHGDLVQASDDSWWLVFLGIRPSDGRHHHLGRETFLAPVTWDEAGWPVVNQNGPIELQAHAALPPQLPLPAAPERDDFDGPTLASAWNFVRNPDPTSFSLTARPGFLRLNGSGASLDEVSQPAFVGRRQQHFACRASTSLEFEPTRAAQVAGLVLRANEANHYDLLVSGDGRSRAVELRARVRGNTEPVARLALTPGPVLLTIEAHPERYEFWSASGGEPARSLGTLPTAPLSSESADGFTGVYFGLYASSAEGTDEGSAKAPTPPADFAWFDYLPSGE